MKHLACLIFVLAIIALPAFGVVGGGDILMKVQDAGGVIFKHTIHVESAGLKCQDCHTKLYVNREQHKTVTMKQMEAGESCGACHNGKKAFSVNSDCKKCHSQ